MFPCTCCFIIIIYVMACRVSYFSTGWVMQFLTVLGKIYRQVVLTLPLLFFFLNFFSPSFSSVLDLSTCATSTIWNIRIWCWYVAIMTGPGKEVRGEDWAPKSWKDWNTQKKKQGCWVWKIMIAPAKQIKCKALYLIYKLVTCICFMRDQCVILLFMIIRTINWFLWHHTFISQMYLQIEFCY